HPYTAATALSTLSLHALFRSQDSEEQLPQRIGGLLNLVEQQDRKLELVGLPLVERFLGEQRMRLAVTQIARRRADQLCDLVRVLEFRAVNLDTGARITEQRLRHRLDYTGLARAGRTEK